MSLPITLGKAATFVGRAGTINGALIKFVAGPLLPQTALALGVGCTVYFAIKGIFYIIEHYDRPGRQEPRRQPARQAAREAQETLEDYYRESRSDTEHQGGDNQNGDQDRGDGDKDREDGDKDKDSDSEDENESDSSHDEEEEMLISHKTYIEKLDEIISRIEGIGQNASRRVRIRLTEKLYDCLMPIFYDPLYGVKIETVGRRLNITISRQGTTDVIFCLPESLRQNLRLNDIAHRLGSINASRQPLVYLFRCLRCNKNYVGLSKNFKSRKSNHISATNRRKNTTPYQHMLQHCSCEGDCTCKFENTYGEFVLLRGLPPSARDLPNIREILEKIEELMQWLLYALEPDGGFGKR